MSANRSCTEGAKAKRGAWCCPSCKNKCKTLAGINRHLYREHKGEGFGIYRTALELEADKRKARQVEVVFPGGESLIYK